MFTLFADVVKWLNEFWSAPVSNRGVIGMIVALYSQYRSYIYNLHFGNDKSALSTPRLYQQYIEDGSMKPGSRILEVGVGSGVYFKFPFIQKIIRDKDLTVFGIDLDADYINSAQEMIASVGLQDRVQTKVIDLFEFKPAQPYDSILFCESAPLIPQWLMTKMVQYIHDNGILAPGGKIVWINNIREDVSQITNTEIMLKRNAKYVPFLNVDFGETLTHAYFEGIGETVPGSKLSYEVLTEIELYKLMDVPGMPWLPTSLLVSLLALIGVRNYNVQQFKVTMTSN